MKALHSFQISATEGKQFFDVLLFANKTEMLAWVKATKPGAPDDFDALTCSRYPNTPCKEGHLGLLLFSGEGFAPSIIQHELLHAAFTYERRVYGNVGGAFPTPESEERICHTQQDLLDDLLFKMDEMGLQEFGLA